MGRPRRPSPPREPATPSQAALRDWLRGPPRRSQMLLAVVCRVSQPLISAYASRRLRPDPDSEAARLLEIATAGRVTPAGWLTPAELPEREARREQAAAFARAIASGARVELMAMTFEPPKRGRRSASRSVPQRTSSSPQSKGYATRRAP